VRWFEAAAKHCFDWPLVFSEDVWKQKRCVAWGKLYVKISQTVNTVCIFSKLFARHLGLLIGLEVFHYFVRCLSPSIVCRLMFVRRACAWVRVNQSCMTSTQKVRWSCIWWRAVTVKQPECYFKPFSGCQVLLKNFVTVSLNHFMWDVDGSCVNNIDLKFFRFFV